MSSSSFDQTDVDWPVHPDVVTSDDLLSQLRWFSVVPGIDYAITATSLSEYQNSPLHGVEPSLPPPATLGCLARFSPRHFDFACDANWHGDAADDLLAIGNGTALIVDSEDKLPDTSFRSLWRDLAVFCQAVMNGGDDVVEAEGLFVVDATGPALRLCHQSFKVFSFFALQLCELMRWEQPRYGPHGFQATSYSSHIFDGPPFQIQNWPASNAAAKDVILRIADSHVAVPLPACDVDGDPILPSDYRRSLEGAVVWVEFHVEHKRDEDWEGFRAFVHSIHVIESPIPRSPPTCNPRALMGPSA